jgi:hypothetical protein
VSSVLFQCTWLQLPPISGSQIFVCSSIVLTFKFHPQVKLGG